MDRIYVTLYRLYRITKRTVIDVLLSRSPVAERAFIPFKRFVTHHFLRGRAVWVQVESGLSKGMWMRLRIPQEAGFLHGEHEPDVQDLIVRMLSRRVPVRHRFTPGIDLIGRCATRR